ncbi:hypothetical protein M426DRAFT_17056 [Hypoxylon sp. CI-4A]|nr:hypothetical protein M426DRAFT_17056 [Hypoxylon sp. CI-4A]
MKLSNFLTVFASSSAVLAVPTQLNNGGGCTPYVPCTDPRVPDAQCCLTPDARCESPTETPTSLVQFQMNCAERGLTAYCCDYTVTESS